MQQELAMQLVLVRRYASADRGGKVEIEGPCVLPENLTLDEFCEAKAKQLEQHFRSRYKVRVRDGSLEMNFETTVGYVRSVPIVECIPV